MAKMTLNQKERQNHRENNGRYAKVNPCYRCGKSAGVDYYADRRTDGLIGDEALVLCAECFTVLDKMMDEELLAEISREDYGHIR